VVYRRLQCLEFIAHRTILPDFATALKAGLLRFLHCIERIAGWNERKGSEQRSEVLYHWTYLASFGLLIHHFMFLLIQKTVNF
jgi:hypothetical protein